MCADMNSIDGLVFDFTCNTFLPVFCIPYECNMIAVTHQTRLVQ